MSSGTSKLGLVYWANNEIDSHLVVSKLYKEWHLRRFAIDVGYVTVQEMGNKGPFESVSYIRFRRMVGVGQSGLYPTFSIQWASHDEISQRWSPVGFIDDTAMLMKAARLIWSSNRKLKDLGNTLTEKLLLPYVQLIRKQYE